MQPKDLLEFLEDKDRTMEDLKNTERRGVELGAPAGWSSPIWSGVQGIELAQNIHNAFGQLGAGSLLGTSLGSSTDGTLVGHLNQLYQGQNQGR